MKKILIIVVLVAGYLAFISYGPNKVIINDNGGVGVVPGDDNTMTGGDGSSNAPIASDYQSYFNEKLEGGVIDTLGQPVEGFRPAMFLEVFPALIDNDFHGVEARAGIYAMSADQLVFIHENSSPLNDQIPYSSADEAIYPKGMATLLSNIAERIQFATGTREDIDNLINYLSGDQ